jgi:iron complex transport system ATP-binding protein
LAPLTLSGGQQRLFMLENVLGTAPDHLVVDGGMVSLDETFRIRAAFLIRRWMAEDPRRTFICFGSDAEQAWFDFERIVALPRRGAIGSREVWPNVADRSDAMAEEVLSFRNVSAGPVISGQRLLQNVSLSLNAGTYAGLSGPNGVGKTTLLRLVAGVRRPARGEIYFRGSPLPRVSWQGLTDGIAYLPQEPELAGPMCVDPTGVNSTKVGADERAFWREFFELDWSGDAETYWSMSSGERARATLMFQAAFSPSVWILDEPTFRIDTQEMIRFLATLRDIKADTSAIIVSHDRAFLDAVVDHQYVLAETGVLVTNSPPPEESV